MSLFKTIKSNLMTIVNILVVILFGRGLRLTS